MGIILWLVFGAIVGWLASTFVKGTGLGLIGDIIVGIVGSFIGSYIAQFLGFGAVTGFNIVSLIIAFLGACLLLFVISLIKKSK